MTRQYPGLRVPSGGHAEDRLAMLRQRQGSQRAATGRDLGEEINKELSQGVAEVGMERRDE